MDQKQLDEAVEYTKHVFGYHGGMGDPPVDDAVLAIVRGTLEFQEHVLKPTPGD